MTEMTDRESLMAARFAALATSERRDWRDVRRRSRRMQLRRAALVLAATVAAVLIAAPALGLDRSVIDFLRAEPAPETARIDFEHWFDEVPPKNRRPGVIPEEARRVHTFNTASGSYVLYVSPASDGFCYLITRNVGQCPDVHFPVLSNGYREIPAADDPTPEPNLISGVVKHAEVERVVLTFEDGERIDLPLVIVSKPIGAGFYFYELPPDRWALGLRPTKVTAHGQGARVLAEARITYGG